MTKAQLRTIGLHAMSAGAGGVAVISFAASHSVDIYAVFDQLNVIAADVIKFVGLITPLITAAIGVYKASTKEKIVDVLADPAAPDIAKQLPVTREAINLSTALRT